MPVALEGLAVLSLVLTAHLLQLPEEDRQLGELEATQRIS